MEPICAISINGHPVRTHHSGIGCAHTQRSWPHFLFLSEFGETPPPITPSSDYIIYYSAFLFTFKVLCAWDIFGHELVQSISLKFPFSQRLPDFGSSILHSFSLNTLTITCNEYIAELKLGMSLGVANQSAITSHSHPVTTALYNPHLHQIVSGCEGGTVSVWEVESGRCMLRMSKCHGRNEITAMVFDRSGRRLITGSSTGEIKVTYYWEYRHKLCDL